jgi:3-phenylpropionate/trans-cinnamate dioxygenase ferredoxin reductase subunit
LDAQSPIVIVGAGQAGIQTAESLRQEGFGGELMLYGDEPYAPYQRPPLSKKWLIEGGATSALALRGPAAIARLKIALHIDTRVRAIDRTRREVELSDGTRVSYGRLALATGSLPRTLSIPGATLPGVLSLRGIADSLAIGATIRQCAARGAPVVVVGGGFIGLEVAAGARKLGAEVAVLEGLPRLMSRVTAPAVSDAFERLHRSHGVQLRFGMQVTEIVARDGQVAAVRTADGAEYPAGCVVIGIGIEPDDALARAAGVACERGILVDDCSRTSDPLIVAAGDCTARRLGDGELVRLESVQNAIEQGRSGAAALMGRERPFVSAPWFWSDQFDVKLQMVGLSRGYDQVVIRGDVQKPAFSAFYFRAGRLLAVDSLNRVSDHMQSKRLLDHHLSPTPEQAADPQFELAGLLRAPPAAAPATTAGAA